MAWGWHREKLIRKRSETWLKVWRLTVTGSAFKSYWKEKPKRFGILDKEILSGKHFLISRQSFSSVELRNKSHCLQSRSCCLWAGDSHRPADICVDTNPDLSPSPPQWKPGKCPLVYPLLDPLRWWADEAKPTTFSASLKIPLLPSEFSHVYIHPKTDLVEWQWDQTSHSASGLVLWKPASSPFHKPTLCSWAHRLAVSQYVTILSDN